MHNSLISVHILKDVLASNDGSAKNASLKLLYTSMNSGPAVKPQVVLEHPNTFIPNSVFFDFQKDFVEPGATFAHTMPNHALFEEKARALGLNNEDEIVVYDDFGNFCASRVWFMFRCVGFTNIKVLDGGLPQWLAHKYPTNNALQIPSKAGNFKSNQQYDFRFVDKHYVLENVHTKTRQTLDARSNSRFSGAEKESKPNVRSGHIPNSINLHYRDLFDAQGRFLPIDELCKKFQNFENDLIFSCGSGVTACLLAQGAYISGKKPLLVYDGSWSEWGADYNLPIEHNE